MLRLEKRRECLSLTLGGSDDGDRFTAFECTVEQVVYEYPLLFVSSRRVVPDPFEFFKSRHHITECTASWTCFWIRGDPTRESIELREPTRNRRSSSVEVRDVKRG
jgi:hypothetical protein